MTTYKRMEFLLVFRRNHQSAIPPLEEEELIMYRKHWQDWFLSLAARQRLTRPVQRWDAGGIAVSREEEVKGNVTVQGLIFIEASDYVEAVAVARDCPILPLGGVVEILQAK